MNEITKERIALETKAEILEGISMKYEAMKRSAEVYRERANEEDDARRWNEEQAEECEERANALSELGKKIAKL